MIAFTTPNGKIIEAFVEPNTAMYRIRFTTGGEIPADLSGMYTSLRIAHQAIGKYLSKLEVKKEKNA